MPSIEEDIERAKFRETLATVFQPTPSQKRLMLGGEHPRRILSNLEGIHVKADLLRQKIGVYRESLTDPKGRLPSNPSVAAGILIGLVGDPLITIADHRLSLGDFLRFSFYADYAEGFASTFSTIAILESGVIRGEGYNLDVVGDLVEKHVGIEVRDATLAEHFLFESYIVKKGLSLLVEDPTGILLISEAVKNIRGRESRMQVEWPLLPGIDRDFHGAGAKLAEILYRALYPIVESTPKVTTAK